MLIRMKDRNRQKTFITIFSVFVAIVLWLFVSYTEDKLMDVKINSIDIQFVGEQTLTSKGLMIVNRDSVPKPSIKIRGRRSDLISVMGGITAKVDVSQIDIAGTHKITPTFNIPSNAVYISKIITQSVELNVAKTVEKEIDVEVMQINAYRNKTFLVESVAEIPKMKIVGEESDVGSIERAVLYVDVSSVEENEELAVKPVFVSKDGKEVIPKNQIFTEILEINVHNTVYYKKTADVNVELPKIENGRYVVSLVSQSFDKIEVGVIDETIQIDTVTANFDDITDIEPGKHKFSLDLKVPDGVYLPNQSIEVEIDVEEYSERTDVVPVTEE